MMLRRVNMFIRRNFDCRVWEIGLETGKNPRIADTAKNIAKAQFLRSEGPFTLGRDSSGISALLGVS